ncbi:39S ribosomal protein L50, mitochondrial-like [Mya arenaria]|nr:39S ribosomal protein L50, mitochondrial-like [Mya arenaria]
MAAPMSRKVVLMNIWRVARLTDERTKLLQLHSRSMGFFDKLKVFEKHREIERLKKEGKKVEIQKLIEDIGDESDGPVDKRVGIEDRKAYTPAEDVVEQIQSTAESFYGKADDWQAIQLTSRLKKFDFVTKLISDLDHDVPNMTLHEMKTVGDVVTYFQTEVRNSSSLDDLNKLNLPKNLHMNLEYIRFHPETDKIYDGYTAFPGRATKVTSLKYKRKYIGYDGGDPDNDPDSLTKFK